jgi:MFS superfamily sulfate permease-like transporter
MLLTTVCMRTLHTYILHNTQIPRIDGLIIVVVTVITPLFDLAIAVACGCAIAALGFAWQSSKRIVVTSYTRPSEGADEPPVVKVPHKYICAHVCVFICVCTHVSIAKRCTQSAGRTNSADSAYSITTC